MSSNKKTIIILVVVGVVYFAFMGIGLRRGSADERDAPEDEEDVGKWMEESIPKWLTSIEEWMPKPRFEDAGFPIALEAGRRRKVEIPPDSENAYREAVLLHLAGPAISLRYVPANPDELAGGAGEDALEFKLQAGPENVSRKAIVIGESGGILHLSNDGSGVARIGLED